MHQGKVYAVKTASTANGVTTTLLDQKGYDPRGRLIREWHSINGGTPVLISSAGYDEMERMSSNALGNSIVTTAFTYDIQNRLRKINDPANLGTKPFAMELQYNSPDVTGATAQYAGNISAARWIQQGASGQTYYYSYDTYSRITDGIHGGGNNEQSIGYDSNGNISALTRTGAQAAGLSYTYSGNRLSTLTKDGTGYSYAYDSNGNTTTDGLRGMTIAYNYLNLPRTVTKGSDVLTYIYDAAGSKLAEKLNSTVNNFFAGAVVYKGDKTIDYIPASTGLIRKVGNDFVRQYNINDHLGNVRAVVNQSGTIEQTTDYYPYGLAFGYNNLDKNRYLYNGKELQNQTLATTFLGVYDYGARYYDPVIGRWNSVDPMAGKYYLWSPYTYVYDNPINGIDPDGHDGVIVVFPDYKISTPVGKIGGLGHAGVLLINNKTGNTRYYEYGRYDKADKGEVRNRSVSDVKIGKNGMPTQKSLDKVMKQISDKAGHGGKIEGAYVKSDKFDEMKGYAEGKMKKNSDSERTEYNLLDNNCGTFSEEVVKQDEKVAKDAPSTIDPRPNSMVKKYQKDFQGVHYDPKSGTTTIDPKKEEKK